jgi:acyl-CoA thioesterase FadM
VKIRFEYRLLRQLPSGQEEVVAEGHTLLACVDQDHVPRRIPPEAEAVLLGPEVSLRPVFEAERAVARG